MNKVLAAAVAVFAAVALAPPASAVHTDVRDTEDTKGKLDLRRVEMRQGPPRKWVLKTHDNFEAETIFDKGYLLVYFDTFGTERFDYYVLLRPTRTKIKGSLWKDAKSPNNDVFLSHTRVRKPNNRTVTTTVPFRKMRTPDEQMTYRWHARSIYSGRNCRRVCIDRAPDIGSITEPYFPTS